jgi:hypothetical protein
VATISAVSTWRMTMALTLPNVPAMRCLSMARSCILITGLPVIISQKAFEMMPGVSGVHLMLFGVKHEVLPKVVEGLR